MKVAITGVPGTGKTSVAKMLAGRLKCACINELAFAKKKHIGKYNAKQKERGIPLREFRKKLDAELSKREDAVVEGHLLCEFRAKADLAVVLRGNIKELERRLKRRGYRDEKLLDNIYCEQINYCGKRALKSYGKAKVVEIAGGKSIKATVDIIISEVKKLQPRKKGKK